MSIVRPPDDGAYAWRAASAEEFARYYSDEGGGGAARARAAQVHAHVNAVLGRTAAGAALRVADIGCGDGTACRLWAERGHTVHGIDRKRALVALARKRATQAGLDIAFDVADPGALPWPARSMDVCIAHGLPQQTDDPRAALRELVRVLKPGGVLYLSTTDALRGARGRGQRQPAVGKLAASWFGYYRLREHLRRQGLDTRDRLDLAWYATRRPLARAALRLLRAIPPLRWLGQLASPRTVLVAVKRAPAAD